MVVDKYNTKDKFGGGKKDLEVIVWTKSGRQGRGGKTRRVCFLYLLSTNSPRLSPPTFRFDFFLMKDVTSSSPVVKANKFDFSYYSIPIPIVY